ncbi:di/tricarboxylate transporter [Donghicola tyrosinivorans]|uniref:Di/tricarboxylate transporter n=2 Tax=Donghicola tyrosinivorans TaxID=1652492 RepID=A0A2T0X4Z4_9RHOB|nr:di/tricarboxylate transporter [Donghicola tyrosinivorans]
MLAPLSGLGKDARPSLARPGDPNDVIALPEAYQALAALLIVGGMFVLFIRETFPTEVVGITGSALMLFLGILPYDAAITVLSNSAPWTIGALFIVMGALVRTGALDVFTRFANESATRNPKIALFGMLVFVVIFSAFVSNTPVVVIMIPVFVQLSRTLGMTPSQLLMPLSYAAILGGTTTLIGTSTNLLVDGVSRSQGLEPFTIFEVTPLGIALVIWGAIYLRFIGARLLPRRESLAGALSNRSKMKFFTEVAIPEDSALIGREVTEVEAFKRGGVRLIDVLRGDASLRRDLTAVVLQAGDRVVLRTEMSELLGLQQSKDLRMVDKLSSVETQTVEVLITPGCTMVGRSLGNLRLRRRYGVYPLAVHRRNQNIGRQLDDLVVRVGDTLLLEGNVADIQRLASDVGLVNVSQPSERAYRRGHAPIALGALVAIVLGSALGLAPILMMSVFAVAFVLLTRCIDADEAFDFVEGRLLALIFSMLAIGAGLEHSGAVELIVGHVAPLLKTLPHFFVIWSIFLLTSILTELVTNNAVAVVVTPIVIGLAHAIGVDPRPLVVAVMVAASASFSTPIGYQTNTLIYGPGGYKFSDFMKVGIPLNLSIGILSALLIPLIWPL